MAGSKKAEAAAGQEVAVVDNKANVPAEFMQELMADAQEFREAMTREDMAIPFIQILQQLSPQCVEGDPAYIDGAKAGMFYNTVTDELFDGKGDGIRLVSIAYKASYIEWVPRSAGGGFVNEYDVAEGSSIRIARNDAGLDIIQSGSPLGTPGNQLSYTHTHYVYVVRPDGTYEPALLTIRKPGGLAQGFHDIEIKYSFSASYMPPVMDELMTQIHGPAKRRLLMV